MVGSGRTARGRRLPSPEAQLQHKRRCTARHTPSGVGVKCEAIACDGVDAKEAKSRIDEPEALFSCKIFCKIDTVTFSFVFDKYCSIMD